MNNPGVMRQQGVCGDNHSEPCDLYQPDFCQGRPAFFDVSVRNTLSPSIISQASVSARAASVATAGDVLLINCIFKSFNLLYIYMRVLKFMYF